MLTHPQNRRLIATFVVFSLMGAPCVMADGSVGETRVASAQPGQYIWPLLIKLEQQIAAENIALPESDNASKTWLRVIETARPATPEIRSALANFAAHARDRSTSEQAAGKEVAAIGFTVFADLASNLLNKKDARTSPGTSHSTGTPEVSSRSAFPTTGPSNLSVPASVGTASPPEAAQPNRANEPSRPGAPAALGMSRSADASGANATRPLPASAQSALTATPGLSVPAVARNSASAEPDGGNAAHPMAHARQTPPATSADTSSSDSTRALWPSSQSALAIAPGPSAPAVVLNSASADPDGGNAAHPTAHARQTPPAASADASSSDSTRAPSPSSQSALTIAPGPSAQAVVLNSASADPDGGNPAHPMAHARHTPPTTSADASSSASTRALSPSSQSALTIAPGPSVPAVVLNSASAGRDGRKIAHPTAYTRQTVPVTALPAASPILALPAIQNQSLAALYATRGDQMLAIKDVSAARRLYEYAANAGSARAAMALARTFDPSFLAQLGVVGLKPDPTLAATWYGKAMALGDRNVKPLLHNLSTTADSK